MLQNEAEYIFDEPKLFLRKTIQKKKSLVDSRGESS